MKEKDHFNWFYTPVESNLKRYRTDVSIYTMFSLLTMLWNQGLPETQFLIATVAYLIPELREKKVQWVYSFSISYHLQINALKEITITFCENHNCFRCELESYP